MALVPRDSRISRRASTRLCLVFFFAFLAAPVLHSQDSAVHQIPVQQSLGVQENQFAAVEEDTGSQTNAPANTRDNETAQPVGTTPDVAGNANDPAGQVQGNPNPAAADQPVTWKNLPRRILGDQKIVWLFPLHVAEGQHLLPTVTAVGITGGLIAADPHIERHLRNTTSFDEFDEIFSGPNTGAVTALIPATFYVYGLVHKSSYAEQTGLLAGEAYLDSAIPEVVMKLVSRRLRPSAVPATSDYTDTFFAAHVSVFGKGSSFPSGHAAGIFSVATVVSERYRRHRWVPWVMYGLAAAISFSRVPTFAHFPSDVFVGAVLGYTITRFDVLRDRNHP